SVDTYISVAKSISGVRCEGDKLWGQVGDDLFACFFPLAGETALLENAERLKQDLAGRCSRTISIGTAAYPTIKYNKDEILGNAKKAVDHAAFFGPDSTVSFDSVSLNISGDKLYQRGDIDEAVTEFETALFLDSNDVNVRNSLGVCYGILGHYNKALEQFDEVIRLDPEDIMAIYNKGHVNLLIGDKEKALEIFLSAGNPGEAIYELVFELGKIYIEKGMYAEGKEYIEKALELKPDSGPAFRYLGECFESDGQIREAIDVYKKAVKQNPYDAFSLSTLGYLFEVSGENVEIATMFCEQSIDISPDNAVFRHRLGQLYYKQNMFEEALTHFKKAEELGHDSSEFIKKTHEQVE
ncbi:MAG: tetratricopeptide repeat protein, partial [Desulfobacterales bacterium]|nr:tetratricopeptide repeat protein [Desulfobacterales bacterium]